MSGWSKNKLKSVSLWQSATVENSKIFSQVLACEYVLICHRKCQVQYIFENLTNGMGGGGYGVIMVGLSVISALVREVEDKRTRLIALVVLLWHTNVLFFSTKSASQSLLNMEIMMKYLSYSADKECDCNVSVFPIKTQRVSLPNDFDL